VTANAYNLLRDLSSYLLPRLLWIDSICIDQENIPEKTKQVKLMGQIYSRVSFVAIWLGSSNTQDSDFDRGEEFLDNVRTSVGFSLIKSLKHIDLRSNNLHAFNILETEGIQPAWKIVLKLLNHDYFQRSWIIQEIVLASSARVVYGKVEMDWEAFAGGLLELTYGNFATNKLSETDGGPTRSLKPTTALANLRQIQNWRGKTQQKEQISFGDIAFAVRRFKATELRDKVFAMHGFCPNTNGGMDCSKLFIGSAGRLSRRHPSLSG
jgi:hypothetical protein